MYLPICVYYQLDNSYQNHRRYIHFVPLYSGNGNCLSNSCFSQHGSDFQMLSKRPYYIIGLIIFSLLFSDFHFLGAWPQCPVSSESSTFKWKAAAITSWYIANMPEDDAKGNPIVPCGLIAWSMFSDTNHWK